MGDTIRFIFRTLIKIPLIIIAVYLVINVIAFTMSYMRLYTLAQVAVNTAMENNFIPESEFNAIMAHAGGTNAGTFRDGLTNNILNEINVTVTTVPLLYGVPYTIHGNARYGIGHSIDVGVEDQRVQYGSEITIEVEGSYLWMLPIPIYGGAGNFGLLNTPVVGMGGGAAPVVNNQAAVENELRRRGLIDIGVADSDFRFPIRFTYTVAGLKYYPDLDATM